MTRKPYRLGRRGEAAEETRRRIVEACYDRARRMLGANRERLESLSRALLEKETLDQDDAYRAAGFEPGNAPAELKAGDGVDAVDESAAIKE